MIKNTRETDILEYVIVLIYLIFSGAGTNYKVGGYIYIYIKSQKVYL